jgi:hypothetical protein
MTTPVNTMSNANLIKRSIAVWAIVCLISGALLYAEQIRRQFWAQDREFSALYSTIGAVLTQNESVLPLLSGDEDIAALRKKFPHILALEKTTDRGWMRPELNLCTISSTGCTTLASDPGAYRPGTTAGDQPHVLPSSYALSDEP